MANTLWDWPVAKQQPMGLKTEDDKFCMVQMLWSSVELGLCSEWIPKRASPGELNSNTGSSMPQQITLFCTFKNVFEGEASKIS